MGVTKYTPVSKRLRRSPHVVSYWDGSQLIYENYLTQVRITALPVCTAILSLFDAWRSPQEIRALLGGYSASSVDRTVEKLRATTFLEEEGKGAATDEAFETWRGWTPTAAFFHFATKDVPYAVTPKATPREFRDWLKQHPQPPFFKHYGKTKVIKLPSDRCVPEGEFRNVLFNRRTWRSFGRQSLALEDLAVLLNLTWGVRKFGNVPSLGRLPLKTSPSAGTRHPIEAYVVPLRIKGLRQGIYHYASDRHQLECLRETPMKRRVIRYLGGQWWFGEAAAIMLMTAVLPRVAWKYRYPRAYRFVLLDAGHLCQTFCLAATWLNLAPFCTACLADTSIERDIGVNGITESVIYAAGVGCRRPPGSSPVARVVRGDSAHPELGESPDLDFAAVSEIDPD